MAVVAVVAAMLSGCGMLPGQQGSGGEERVTGTLEVADPTKATEAAEPTEAVKATEVPEATETVPAERERVIARREVKASGADLTVEITGLRRQGRLSTLTWTVTNNSDERWQMNSDMGDTPGGLGLTVAGVSLVDPVNGKRYAVARTAKQPKPSCLCSEYDVFTQPGEVLPLHASFAAPPPDVTKINVDLKVLGVFSDVPIS
ncbi:MULTISPECIES: hypothetical protein [unclassified Streptosporangium]|uniref:hypothetical protein n=1 Tax=unclassified Streptosporangium TaxID=2632669 RepID=UPI002E2D1396|nr:MULTISPECIES: hypothetical protein [unclassified Streptosporangium]